MCRPNEGRRRRARGRRFAPPWRTLGAGGASLRATNSGRSSCCRRAAADVALCSSDYTQLEEDGVRAALCGRTTPFVRAPAGDCSEERAVPVGARPAVPARNDNTTRGTAGRAPTLQIERGKRCHTDSETITPQGGKIQSSSVRFSVDSVSCVPGSDKRNNHVRAALCAALANSGRRRSFAPRDELWARVRRALRPDNALRSSDYTQLEEDGVRAALCGRTTPFVRAPAGDCSEERAVPVGARPAVPARNDNTTRGTAGRAPTLQIERGKRCHTDFETITPQGGKIQSSSAQ